MARIVAAFPTRSKLRTFYPWDEWLDGQVRVLTRGEDFHTPIASFRVLVSTTCKKRGLTGRARVISDTEVALQALGARPGHGAP